MLGVVNTTPEFHANPSTEYSVRQIGEVFKPFSTYTLARNYNVQTFTYNIIEALRDEFEWCLEEDSLRKGPTRG